MIFKPPSLAESSSTNISISPGDTLPDNFEFGEITFNFNLAAVDNSHQVTLLRNETMRKSCKICAAWLRLSDVG